MGVTLAGSEILHLDATRMWVQTTHFAVSDATDDRTVLAELLAADGYGHDYASPFGGRNTDGPVPVHGRWTLASITPTSFEPADPDRAGDVLRTWATVQNWTDPEFTLTSETRSELDRVIGTLRRGTLLRLVHPGDEHEHGYGWVTGDMGFHEYVVIDRPHDRVSVVVASDD